MDGLVTTLLEPRFVSWFLDKIPRFISWFLANIPRSICWFLPKIFIVLIFFGLLWEGRRRLRGRRPRISGPWIKRPFEWVVRILWSVIKLLILPGGGGAAPPSISITTIAPAPLLQSQQSTTVNIWNEDSLRQGLRSFKKKIHHIQCGMALSPNASNSSSPRHFMYSDWVSSANEGNSDQHLQFQSSLQDHVDVNLIDCSFLSQLTHMILQRQNGGPGYQQMLYQEFENNSVAIISLFYNVFNSAGLSFNINTCMDASQFTYGSASCVMNLKITTGFLCAMWDQLSAATCQSFHQDLKKYFTVCASQPIENLIEAACSISNMKWSASDHIFDMLVLYEATFVVARDIQHLSSGHPNLFNRIIQQMRHNFKGVSNGITCFICNSLDCSENGITCVSHPATGFLVQSMKLFKDHNNIVQHISRNGDGSSYLGHLLFEVIRNWAEKLEEYSELLTQGRSEGRKYMFLLNNLSCFSLEIKNTLQALLPNNEHEDILNFLDSLSNDYESRYLEACWGPVRDCLKLNSGRKCYRLAFLAFISKFIDVCDCQRTWVLNIPLKEDIRKKIRVYIAPSCYDYLIALWKRSSVRCFKLGDHERHKTIEKLLTRVDELFESGHEE